MLHIACRLYFRWGGPWSKIEVCAACTQAEANTAGHVLEHYVQVNGSKAVYIVIVYILDAYNLQSTEPPSAQSYWTVAHITKHARLYTKVLTKLKNSFTVKLSLERF